MKLAFFTMPMHPVGKDWQVTLKEDREAFILADQLGFVEGYVGEHTTDPEENITSSAMFLATLVDATKNMKLGTGTVNMPNQHPAQTAANIAMLDHLLGGRFIFGISPGALPSDAEVLGNIDMPRPAMFKEAINQVLALWTQDPPYDIKGEFWSMSTKRTFLADTGLGTIPKPLQRPHPPIVVTSVSPFSQGVADAAERGWTPISANFLLPIWVKSHWVKYLEGCAKGKRKADPKDWRIAKTIFVCSDAAKAKAYATGPDGPYYYYYRTLFSKLKRRGALGVFKNDPNMPDDKVTLEDVVNQLVIHGPPEKVADELLAFKETVGDFGTLVYGGVDWKDRDLARNSMIMTAEKVMPLLNK